jgi:hypothetical protein
MAQSHGKYASLTVVPSYLVMNGIIVAVRHQTAFNTSVPNIHLPWTIGPPAKVALNIQSDIVPYSWNIHSARCNASP